ncbi:solute carrier family 22 member 18 isoform X3 [Apteryx mantelli]|uniref:Solute carrier family 22 member 18 isoform X3 n=1 Tax=Apteryx mantelli TaxID=2696672 RepID=A0A8B7JRL8_9AVES
MSAASTPASSGAEQGAARTKSEGEERSEEAKKQQVILVAYLIATLDLIFLFMQLGVMPYLAKSLGLDSVGFGYLQTTFGVLQLVGGPIFGRFADQFGARAALMLSCSSGSAFFLLASISTSVPLLFLSRLPAVFMHGIPGAQKVITDLTTPSQRAGALGKLGLCFGIGIIVGSALGGVLSTKFGIFVPIYVGLVGSLVSTAIVMVWIPSQAELKSEHPVTQRSPSQSGSVFSLREILRLMKFPGVMEVFIIKVFAGLPIGLFLIMFSIISMDFFGLEAVQSGYLMSYFGVLQMCASFPGCPGPGHRKTNQPVHGEDPAAAQRLRLRGSGPRHGPDEERAALLHRCGAAGVRLQHAGHHHGQHPHQVRPRFRHWHHAGNLRFGSAPHPDRGASHRRPFVQAVRSLLLWVFATSGQRRFVCLPFKEQHPAEGEERPVTQLRDSHPLTFVTEINK